MILFPRSGGRRGPAYALVAAAIGLLAIGPLSIGGAPEAEAKEGAKKHHRSAFEYGCRVQKPQAFLKRRVFVKNGMIDGGKQARAVRWLAEHYGHVDDETTRKINPNSARGQAKIVRFMGLPVMIHEKIAPALACVEKRIRKTCKGRSRYTPHAIGGFRDANTYRGPEVSNHLFGIAIDIDPDQNPCCGCVDPWPTNPICKVKTGSVYERTALPKRFIKAFERYGFDWLGHDSLEDTMHFEFLGDPDRIKIHKKKKAPPKSKKTPASKKKTQASKKKTRASKKKAPISKKRAPAEAKRRKNKKKVSKKK